MNVQAQLNISKCFGTTYGLGHADTGIADGQGLVLLVGDDTDVELLLGIESGGVSQRLVPDFVDGIGGVGDDFTKEDLLVGVESV